MRSQINFEAQQLNWRPISESVKCFSIVSGTIAALGNRKSAKEQNALQAQQNADNLQLQLASRGAPINGANVPESIRGTSSAILPYYFGDTEENMGTDAAKLYDAIRANQGSPELRLADYSRLLDTFQPGVDSADALALDLATGKMTQDQLDEARPTFAARRGVATANRNAGLEALRETLNEIDSIQAGKGYSGDSTGNRMLRFNARRQIGTQAARDFAGVDLENAMDERTIREAGRASRLANLSLPDSRAAAAIGRKQLPERMVAADFSNAIEPFKFFNISPHQFTPGVAPNAMPNTLGDVATQIGQTGVQVGTALTNYYKNKNLQDQAYRSKTNEGDTSGWKYLMGGGGGAPDGTTYDADYSYAPGVNPWGSSY